MKKKLTEKKQAIRQLFSNILGTFNFKCFIQVLTDSRKMFKNIENLKIKFQNKMENNSQ